MSRNNTVVSWIGLMTLALVLTNPSWAQARGQGVLIQSQNLNPETSTTISINPAALLALEQGVSQSISLQSQHKDTPVIVSGGLNPHGLFIQTYSMTLQEAQSFVETGKVNGIDYLIYLPGFPAAKIFSTYTLESFESTPVQTKNLGE